MKNAPKAEIGSQYEELTLILSQLNTDAPKIQKLYKELKNNTDTQNQRIVKATKELDELSEVTLQAIQEERDSAATLFKQYSSTAENALSDAQKLQQQLVSFSELVESTSEIMKTVDQRLASIEAKLQVIETTIGGTANVGNGKNVSKDSFIEWVAEQGYDLSSLSLKERIALKNEYDSRDKKASSQRTSRKKSVVIDYEKVTTAKDLYDKYHGKIDGPLIIQRTNWFGDYAFVVNELYKNDTWVRGVAYVDGKFRRNASYHADTEEFRMYNGPSAAKIRLAHEEMDDLPF